MTQLLKSDTIPIMFLERAAASKDRPALSYKSEGRYKDITWGQLAYDVRLLAVGLYSLGIKKQDKAAILSENRPEWIASDLAISSCGVVNVPIYVTDTQKDSEYILSHSQSKIIFVSNRMQLDKINQIRDNLPNLSKIIVFDKSLKSSSDKLIISLSDLKSLGRKLNEEKPSLYDQLVGAVRKEDLASIIYTSGTTGPPKGVMLTHDNFMSNCCSCAQTVPLDENDVFLSFLPLSHVFERTIGEYMMIFCGVHLYYAENMDSVTRNMLEVKPTVMLGVPRFFEKVYARILESAVHANPLKKNLFFWGIRVGRKRSQSIFIGRKPGLLLEIGYKIAKLLVLNKLREKLGGRLRFFISGGAPLSKEIAKFFYSADILILEGYGLTESSPVISVNRLDHFKFGTVGLPIPGVKVKIAGDGEILVKGPNIMEGYYKKTEETEEAIKDGWLYTGDVGRLDKENFLKITDRKKDIIVTAGGKNIAPQNIENLLKTDRFIQDAMVYGDRKKYLTALIVPEFELLEKYAKYKNIGFSSTSELTGNPKIINFISRRIYKKMKELPGYEQIKKFALMDKNFTQDAGELTPTLKIKRRQVTEIYRDILESLY